MTYIDARYAIRKQKLTLRIVHTYIYMYMYICTYKYIVHDTTHIEGSTMAEVPMPSDDSDVYNSGGSGCDESNTSATSSDQRRSSVSRGSRFSSSAEELSECINEEMDDMGSTDSSVYLDQRSIDVQDSDEAFNLDVAGDSDLDGDHPVSDEEDEDIPSPGDFASLLKETHFQLVCNGSNTVFIEAMVLIFQFALK